ncbi:hypothetical protein P7C70_g6546, partial [Phenoliferia sp. Uapishka_3]
MKGSSIIAALGALSLTAAAQLPIGFLRDSAASLAPESSPAFIGENDFTTLSHPDFTEHSVRIKKTTNWCDPNVRSFTGYIDAGPRHLFFYYFDSRDDPAKDDLVLWTNGGPGCSRWGLLGVLIELPTLYKL